MPATSRRRSGRWSRGALRPVIDSEFPIEQAAEAHARMEGSSHIGKIVLKL